MAAVRKYRYCPFLITSPILNLQTWAISNWTVLALVKGATPKRPHFKGWNRSFRFIDFIVYPLREKVTATEVLAKHVELPSITLSALRQGYIALLMISFIRKLFLDQRKYIYIWQENEWTLSIKSRIKLTIQLTIWPDGFLLYYSVEQQFFLRI